MLILKHQDILSLLSNLSAQECSSLLSSLHGSIREYSRTRTVDPSQQMFHQPHREVIETTAGNTSLFMPCSITTSTGIKIITASSGGLKGCINVFSPTGELEGVLNAEELTAFRTALAVMNPYNRYQGPKANIVVFGGGKQAGWHVTLALLLGGRSVERVTLVNRSQPKRLETLFGDLREQYPGVSLSFLLKTNADYDEQLQKLLVNSHVIFCCTPSTTPHFPYSYLTKDKNRLLSLIGSYKPSMHEIDTETLRSGGRIYVDTIEGCLTEAGELITAGVTKDDLVEIWGLEDDEKVGAAGKGNVIFKSVGLGLMDLIVARDVLQMAKTKGLGLVVDDF